MELMDTDPDVWIYLDQIAVARPKSSVLGLTIRMMPHWKSRKPPPKKARW